jgi:predicted nucleic acid-binding Zn ribbon protein
MEAIRSLLHEKLRVSLRGMRDEDRMAAAWTVACGRAMAERGSVVGYEAGVVRVEVVDAVWIAQMRALDATLRREMAQIAGLPVVAIHFELKKC